MKSGGARLLMRTEGTYSGNLSIEYLCLTTYMSGTPGTLRILLRKSRSHFLSASTNGKLVEELTVATI
jgi:hypothetical protein